MANEITVPTQAGTDSHAKTVLDAVEAVIERRASKSQMEQAIDGVQIKHMDILDLVRLRKMYAAEYRREEIAAGNIVSRRKIKVRFV